MGVKIPHGHRFRLVWFVIDGVSSRRAKTLDRSPNESFSPNPFISLYSPKAFIALYAYSTISAVTENYFGMGIDFLLVIGRIIPT